MCTDPSICRYFIVLAGNIETILYFQVSLTLCLLMDQYVVVSSGNCHIHQLKTAENARRKKVQRLLPERLHLFTEKLQCHNGEILTSLNTFGKFGSPHTDF